MHLSRREFIKTGIAASTAATVGLPISKMAEAAAAEDGAGDASPYPEGRS